jgi:hypothetical protein
MRTTKRFTPTVLERFEREGRGTGTYTLYIPQHRVSRGDPASSGRSHLLVWRDRMRELLSDGELHQQLFATMFSDIDDALEQKKLSLGSSAHLLADYGEAPPDALFPGTLELAHELGIKHPKLKAGEDAAWWVMTTDLVLVFRLPESPRTALALAFKTEDYKESKRTCQLLRLEREYWVRRSVPWLLITPETFERAVALTLRRIAAWSLGDHAPEEALIVAARTVREYPIDSVTRVLERLGSVLGSYELAQRALWQAVWHGVLPVDLRRGWRPHTPLRIVSDRTYIEFNPIAARRSAWN